MKTSQKKKDGNMDDYNASTEGTISSISLEDLKKAMELIPPCPFKEFMKKEGCNPNDGWIMIIPDQLEREFGNLPQYVKTSPYVAQPVMINPNHPDLNFLMPILKG
jgi:hypothetical protein